MGFWSDLFGEPKHFTPSQKYSSTPETGQDAVKLERPTRRELRNRFDKLCVLLDDDLSVATWPGWTITASTSLDKITVKKDNTSGDTLSVYKDETMYGANNRVYGAYGLSTYESFILSIEALIAKGTIKIERTPEGKVIDLLEGHTDRLMISKDSQIAFLWSGSTLVVHTVKYDSELELKYVETDSSYVRERYRWISSDSVSWKTMYDIISKFDLSDYKPCETRVSIQELWLDEFAQGQLRSRILREQDLDTWMQDIIGLHVRYNDNAKQYSFAEAGPLDSPESLMIFLHLIRRTPDNFTPEELTNYLRFKGMLRPDYNSGSNETQCPVRLRNTGNLSSKFISDTSYTRRPSYLR